MNVGIDALSFYSPHYYLDLSELAKARDHAPDHFKTQTGQHKMAVPAPDEDIVTMAANAAQRVIARTDPNAINMLLFCTESGIDQSKAAGLYVHQLLNLPSRCRVVELKQACYSATHALQLAASMAHRNPHHQILVIASDIARYTPGTPAEASQGAGAVAMLIKAQPRIATLSSEAGFYAEDAMDFWRPNYRREAFVEGKLSCDLYLKALRKTWEDYHAQSARAYPDHAAFCYHVPVPRLAEKAHQRLAKLANQTRLSNDDAQQQLTASLAYSRETGNCYTASLYASLISLLDHSEQDLTNQHVGMYSYGSGCMGEFYSLQLQPHYKTHLDTVHHQQQLASRTPLTFDTYQQFFHFNFPTQGEDCTLPHHKTGTFRLHKIANHQRLYESTR